MKAALVPLSEQSRYHINNERERLIRQGFNADTVAQGVAELTARMQEADEVQAEHEGREAAGDHFPMTWTPGKFREEKPQRDREARQRVKDQEAEARVARQGRNL